MRLYYQGLPVLAKLVLHSDFEDCYIAVAFFEDTGEFLTDMELEYLRNYNIYVLQDMHAEFLEKEAV